MFWYSLVQIMFHCCALVWTLCFAVICHDCLACSVPVSCASIVLLVGLHAHVVFVLVRYLEIPVGCHLFGTCCLDDLWHGAQQDACAHACC